MSILAKENGGVFPLGFIYDIIDGRSQVMVHGPREMPVWGERYRREVKSHMPPGEVSDDLAELMVRKRILMLIEYLTSLQSK